MDEIKWDTESIQNVLNYYRNKCNQFEYEYILYKTTTERKIRELHLIIESINNRSDSVSTTKKPNGKQDKSTKK